MAALGLGLELELGLQLGPGFNVRVSRVCRVRVSVRSKARAVLVSLGLVTMSGSYSCPNSSLKDRYNRDNHNLILTLKPQLNPNSSYPTNPNRYSRPL